jgi:hypothetical protein
VHWGNDSIRMHLQESIRLSVVWIILSLKISSGLTGAEVDTADALHSNVSWCQTDSIPFFYPQVPRNTHQEDFCSTGLKNPAQKRNGSYDVPMPMPTPMALDTNTKNPAQKRNGSYDVPMPMPTPMASGHQSPKEDQSVQGCNGAPDMLLPRVRDLDSA